ncbi:MAG: FtsX-like permease family protein, partial [Gammaproteobacteria bacterium]|nr:FtsX-like permease family protein [Gammaproteobacteria bacterium]
TQSGIVSVATAQSLNILGGDTLNLVANGKRMALKVLHVLPTQDEVQRNALNGVLLVDIATAQESLGTLGVLSSIELIIEDESMLEKIRTILPDGVQLLTSASRGNAQKQMTRAFQVNLTALSLLALVIGMFLIYNSMSFAVLRRRPQIGMLRAIGVSRRQVFNTIMVEAALIGVVASVVGILLGLLLAQGLLQLVTRTINDLYFNLSATIFALSGLSLFKGIFLGLGATLLAAAIPAYDATNTPPRAVIGRSELEHRTRNITALAFRLGLILFIASFLLFILAGGIVSGFAGLFFLILGYALISPSVTVRLSRIKIQSGWLPRMALRNIGKSLSRTGVAIAALTVAVSTTIGVGVMIGSFRHTVEQWLSGQLRADIYLAVPSSESTGLASEFMSQLTNIDGVEKLTRGRWFKLESQNITTNVFAVDAYRPAFNGFALKRGEQDTAWKLFTEQDHVLITEPFAYHRQLDVGDSVILHTASGPHKFPVAGIYYEYGSDQGLVTMSFSTFTKYWGDSIANSAALYLNQSVNPERIVASIENHPLAPLNLAVRSNSGLLQASMTVFDRTFTITSVLRFLAIIVAAVGIFAALMCYQLERAREFSVLRTLGLTPAQLWCLIETESGIMGVIAGVLAVPLGLLTALVLIRIINQRSFGWTMQYSIDPMILLQALLLAVAAALLAGLYPAYRLSRSSPANALREE